MTHVTPVAKSSTNYCYLHMFCFFTLFAFGQCKFRVIIVICKKHLDCTFFSPVYTNLPLCMTSFYIDDLIAVESRFDLYVLCKQETMTHLEFRYTEESVTNIVIFFIREIYLHFFFYSFNQGFQSTTYSRQNVSKNKK